MSVVEQENRAVLSRRELEDEIATLAAHIHAGTCRWLELVAELDRRADRDDAWSTAEWLAWRCGLSPRAAREHVRVAGRLDELALIHEAFAAGELSYAKVRALTRIATEETEQELLGLARSLTAAQLDRAVACYRRVSAAEANRLHELAYFDYFRDADGMLYVKGRLAPEDGSLVLRALEAGRDRVRERESEWDEERRERIERGPAGPHEPKYRPTNADALVAMADAALSAQSVEHAGGERYQVIVHVDAGDVPALDDGPAVARETADRISCDAALVSIVEKDGKPLSIGRKTRVVPSAMRRALRARDAGCRFPGCQNRRFVDAHHIRHWSRGGETRLDNLVLLCRRHHRLVHEGGYSLALLPDGDLAIENPWGRSIPAAPASPRGSPRGLARRTGIAAGPWTCRGGESEKGDIAYITDVLFMIMGGSAVGCSAAC